MKKNRGMVWMSITRRQERRDEIGRFALASRRGDLVQFQLLENRSDLFSN